VNDRSVDEIAVDYFDGINARPVPARLRRAGQRLWIEGDGLQRELDPAAVDWPERRTHGARVAHLSDGASLQAVDAAAWDAFVRAAGLGESWVVRAQQNWRTTLAAVVLLIGVLVAGYLWGLPLASRAALAFIPERIDRAVGEAAWAGIEGRWLLPSRLPATDQQRLRDAFARAVERADPAASRPAYILHFHRSRLGPNAFALPGGTIVVTDELVELLRGRDDAIVGVLAHELGHVRHRHGMRMLVQVTLLGTITAAAFGDFSSVLAGAPALFGQLAYSRDAEREADAESVRMLRAAGISPAVMAEFFERMDGWRHSDEGRRQGADFDPGIAFSSHPADAERIAFFRRAALP
jgi:Zn-dependent protease with chaperone function